MAIGGFFRIVLNSRYSQMQSAGTSLCGPGRICSLMTQGMRYYRAGQAELSFAVHYGCRLNGRHAEGKGRILMSSDSGRNKRIFIGDILK